MGHREVACLDNVKLQKGLADLRQEVGFMPGLCSTSAENSLRQTELAIDCNDYLLQA